MSESNVLAPRLVRASAGTGKTWDLSSRYIALLALGETPDKILATTFTRKAAAEIRERIFGRLADAAASADAARELGKAIGKVDFDQQQARCLLGRLVEKQHRLLITTLDALFISMAKSFALELALPINWRIESDQDGLRLRELAIQELLKGEDNRDILDIIRLINGGDLARSVHKGVVDAVERLFRFYLATDSSAWNWAAPGQNEPKITLKEVDKLLSEYGVREAAKVKPMKHQLNLAENLRAIASSNDWKKFGALTVVTRVLSGDYEFHRQPLDPTIVTVVETLIGHATRYFRQRLSDKLQGAHRILELYQGKYREAQRRLGILTFDDVKQILASHSLTGKLEPLYYRLDSRICHLLLDEFQDTSMNEWRILEPVADEILSRPTERSFFCVGDMKQAIYGWRGGVAEIFGSIERRWSHLIPESKHTTYRCAPAIVEFVNTLFSSVNKLACLKDLREPVARWVERFEPHFAAQTEKQGQVSLHQIGHQEDIPHYTVNLVSELHEKYPAASIGVLVRKNKTVAELLASFSETHPGLAVSEEGSVKVTDSPLIRALMSLLRAVDNPGDSLANFHVEHSGLRTALDIPFIANAIDPKWREDMRTGLLLDGYGVFFSRWARILVPQSGELDRQRLEQLVDQAYLYDDKRTLRIVDFVAFIERSTVELPTHAPIRVMSLHKSKGLEFDIVVLPELDDSIEVKKDEVLFEQESPISPITRVALGSGTQFERAVIPELDRLWRKKLYALVAESLSLLYVGVTRPRQILHLVVPAPKKEPKASAAGIVIESLSNGEGQQVLFGASDVVIEQRAPIKRSVRTFNSRVNFVKTEGERGLTRVSPAQLKDKFQLSDPRVYKVGRNARERGTALHLLFEQIGWLDDFNLESLKTETILEYLGTDTARTIIDEFAAMIRNQTIVSELSKARFSKYDRVNLYREQKFAVQQDDRIVSGVIDRLVVGYSGSNPVWAEIIDYKSDKLDSPNSLAERVELYREQIALYALGARALIGCDLGIATKIIFLDGPVVVDCS